MPRVSVIMSVYNNVRELPRAMHSLFHQTFHDVEVVAIDDGSTDGSSDLLDHYAAQDSRIRVIHQLNSGLGPALHRACLAASGEYLARQDADDMSAPTRFERQVAYMDRHPDVAVCGTWTWFIHPEKGPKSSWEIPDDHQLLLKLLESGANPLIHGSVMIRRAVYDHEGVGYRFRRFCEEFDLWLRLSAFGKLASLPSVEYLYWVSVGGMSYGNIVSCGKLKELALRLHREQKSTGAEISDWRREEAAILSTTINEDDFDMRQTAAMYIRGLEALRTGDWKEFRHGMAKAAAGRGPLAAKAKLRLRVAWMAPLLRMAYRFRDARGHGKFIKDLARGTPLPAYAVCHASVSSLSASGKIYRGGEGKTDILSRSKDDEQRDVT